MSKREKSSNNEQANQAPSGIAIPSRLSLSVLAGAVIISLVACLSYLPSINGGFIFDDNLLITKNYLIRNPDGLRRIWCTTESVDYWPVTNTSFCIEWRLWGTRSTGYHVTNLIFHIVEALLIWVILRKMSIPAAFLAAVLFAVHPVNVESVAWIASRKNIAAMMFFLLTIFWYLKAQLAGEKGPLQNRPFQPHAGPCYWLSFAAFALAMLSKGSVVILPLLMLGIVWWSRSLTRRDLLRILPFFILAVFLAGVNIWFQTHGKDIHVRNAGFIERLLGAGGVVWFYLYKVLLPLDLAFFYPLWRIEVGNPLWWLPLLAALAVTVVLWINRKTWSRPLLFSWGFFCASLVPVMGFTDLGFMKYSLVADHYQHIAIIGVIALTAAGWSIWRERTRNRSHRLSTAVAVVAVGLLAFLSWRQSGLYHDAVGLFQSTLKINPGSWPAHNCLGIELEQEGRLQDAIEHFRQALQLNPFNCEAENNLGMALDNAGRIQEAIEHYRQALQLVPDYPPAHNNLGIVLMKIGQSNEAIEHYRRALSVKPNDIDAYNNLGCALVQTNRFQEAVEYYQRALSLDADLYYVHNNMGYALEHTGRIEDAINHYEKALQLNPNHAESHNNLANALTRIGHFGEAIRQYELALSLKPGYTKAHVNLAAALIQTGHAQEAIEHCRQALLVDANNPEAHQFLGNSLMQTGRPGEAIAEFKEALCLRPDYVTVYYNLALACSAAGQSSEAVAAAQKGLELARSTGQVNLAKQIENWLSAYRLKLSNSPHDSPPSQSNRPEQ